MHAYNNQSIDQLVKTHLYSAVCRKRIKSVAIWLLLRPIFRKYHWQSGKNFHSFI